MAASSRGPQAAMPLLRRAPQLCTRCATLSQRIPASSRRPYSSTASAPNSTTTTNLQAPSPNILPVTSGSPADPVTVGHKPTTNILHPKSLYRLRAGIILSRPPILTRTQTPFENAFYLYQKRLNERLSSPFARQFYFSPDQPSGIDFSTKFEERSHVMAREVGRLTRRGRDAWDDEALVEEGEKLADPAYIREKLYTEAESRVSEDGEALSFEDRLRIERPRSRETVADQTSDVTRLDRKLERTLYLVVRNSQGRWGFPRDDVRPDEGLYDTAVRALEDTAGINMNTWIVGRHPIAYEHREPIYKDDEKSSDTRKLASQGTNVFYLKGRIMAGQADLTNNEHGITEFKWLTKDELKEQLQPGLYYSVEKSMPAQ